MSKKKLYVSGRKRRGWYKKPIDADSPDIEKLFGITGPAGLMIKFGLYWGLRVSEIVSLKWGDLMERPGYVMHQFDYVVAKQSNIRQTMVDRGLRINKALKNHIMAHFEECGRPPMELYLFYPSQKRNLEKHLTEKSAREWIKRAARAAKCINADIDFHTLRRTSFLKYYKKNGLAQTMAMTGHTTPAQLLTYLGITKEDVLDGFDNLWDEEYVSLMDMYERGMIAVGLNRILAKPAVEWQALLCSELSKYSSDIDEINSLARALLLPHRAQKIRL